MARSKSELQKTKEALNTSRELCDALREQLDQCRKDHQKAAVQAEAAKAQWDWHAKRLNDVIKEREHQQRLVRTLLDVLADKYHPLPTNIHVSMDYRVADKPANWSVKREGGDFVASYDKKED